MKNKQLKRYSKFALLFIIYSIIGIIFTYPLVSNFTNSVPNNMYIEADHTYEWGDHLQIIAGFREHKNYLQNLWSGEPLLDKEFCFEGIEDCNLSNFHIAKNLLFSPFWLHTGLNLFFDDPVVYNLSIVLSFPLVGIVGYLLAEFIVRRRFKFKIGETSIAVLAFLSSLFVVLAPIRIHHLLVGHKNGYMIAFLLAVFLLLEYFFHTRKQKYLWVLLLCFTFLAFSEQFFTYWGLLYIAIRIAWEELPKLFERSKNKLYTIFLYTFKWVKEYWVVALSSVIAVVINYSGKVVEISNSEIASGRPFSLIEFYSPSSWAYLWTKNILEHEHSVYIGLFGIFVLFGALGLLIREWKNNQKNRYIWLISLLAVFFLVVSLGSLTPVYKILYDYFPGFGLSRTPVRAMFMFYPLLGIIAAFVIGKFVQNLKPKKHWMFFLPIFILIIFNFKSFQQISLTGLPESVEIPGNSKVLFLPITEAGHFFNSIYEFQISGANSLMINGYHPYRMNKVIDFEENYAPILNKSAIEGEDIEIIHKEILDELEVDRVIVLPRYLNDDRIEKL
jgi:hypothetical protein